MQNTKNQAHGSGIHARHNPTNDKTVSDDLQNVSGNIVAPPRYRLTKLGEQMARLPIDPKIARILLAAKKHDCMAEILVIASALSIQDPRERPLEARDAAAKAHERFTDKQSDFLAYLNIWDSFQRERDKGLSNKQLVQWCRQYFLSHLRMREWRELHHQLAQTAIEMGLTTKEAAFRRPPEVRQLTSSENAGDQDLSAKLKQKQLDKKQHRAQIRAAKEAGYEQIHRALLTGLIANVGMKSPDGNDYTGARGSRFHLFPASALFKAKPKWVMAAELIETTKLYARDVAAIQPEWIEQEAPHLVRYHYFEPHWEQKRGEVIASERVTLYGLTVLPRRPVSYGRIAPEEAREIFIRSALVAQEVADFNAPFFVHNQKLIREIAELEHKSRRQDVLVDEEALFAFYDARLPKAVFKERGEIVGQAGNGQRSSENLMPSETVGRILESDSRATSAVSSDTSIRPTHFSGSLKDNRQPENHLSDDLKGSLKPHIRPATTSDTTAVAELFRRAVQHISNRHYSEQEKSAWLQGADNADFWQKRIDGGNVRVATHNGRMLGFIEYQPEQSHLNCLFTDPSHQRQGIATTLLNAVLPSADSSKTITVDASKAALAFFQKQGFVRQHENQIPRNGLVLTNYRMVRQANHVQKQPENKVAWVATQQNAQTSSETPFRAERLTPKGFAARQMTAADLDALYGLCQSQPDYYRHLGEPLTREKLARSLTALPPQACRENKHFIGFWQQGSLKAALEIIFAYPDAQTVLLGLLMVDKSAQGAGIGSNIAQNLATVVAESGYREIILSYAEGNAPSRAFWLKNGFAETGEIDEAEEQGGANLITMSRCLPSERQPETANPTNRAVPSPARGGGLGWEQTPDTPANPVSTKTAPPPQPSPAQAQEREQSAAASTLSDDLRPANPQQTTPSPAGEGWGEGKTVAAQTNFSPAAANPLPNPLPQEREQSAAASTLSDDPKPQKQPAPPKGRLKPLPLADIRTFQAWLKTTERDNPRLLFLSRDDLMQHAAAHITEEQFPKHWQTADGKFKLSYRFEPHHPLDGVTLTLPLTVLNRISPAALEWLVPGMIREKIQLQIKALPKQIRRICVPVPEFITQFLSQNPDRNAPILPQLTQAIAKTAGDIRILEQINQDEWAAFRLPEHCYFNLRIIDDGGQELAMGRDLIQIQQQLGKAAATTFRDNTQEFERDNVTAWDIGTLPESIKFARGKQQLTGYLGLQKEKDGRIALRLFDTSAAAEQAHRLGVIELMKLQLKEQVKDLNKGIQGFTQAAMLLKHINADTLRDDLTQAVCDRAFIGEDELPRNEKAFKEQIKRARSRLPAVKEALSRYLQETAAAYAELNGKLGKHPLTHLMRQRLQTLLAAGFATRTPWAQWPRLPIYLKAMTLRLEKYSSNPARDAAREADIQELEQMWQEKTDGLVKQGLPVSDDLAAFRWMIEELRVSLFAQELKTPYPVSVKRLLKEWDKGDR